MDQVEYVEVTLEVSDREIRELSSTFVVDSAVDVGTSLVSAQEGVTGVIVMSSSCRLGVLISAEAVISECDAVDTISLAGAEERAIGPAEQVHAKMKMIGTRMSSIICFWQCRQLTNDEDENDLQNPQIQRYMTKKRV